MISNRGVYLGTMLVKDTLMPKGNSGVRVSSCVTVGHSLTAQYSSILIDSEVEVSAEQEMILASHEIHRNGRLRGPTACRTP
jgi:hypothetical protein